MERNIRLTTHETLHIRRHINNQWCQPIKRLFHKSSRSLLRHQRQKTNRFLLWSREKSPKFQFPIGQIRQRTTTSRLETFTVQRQSNRLRRGGTKFNTEFHFRRQR